MSPEALRARLEQFPRRLLGVYPTPLESLDNLTRALGGPRLWVKRDDGIGPAMGGNKGRKLEFLMAEAVQWQARKVVTFGGLHSNHARMTAAACAALALEAHLFFFERRPALLQGNLLLDELLGARLHFIPFDGGSNASMTIERANQLVSLLSRALLGPGAYFVPVGGHNVTGCLGYVVGALELHEQATAMGLPLERVIVVTAAGTGGTLAGLMAGMALLESPIKTLGIDVGKLWRALPASLARLAGKLCAALAEDRQFRPEDVPLIEGRYAGLGYGVLTPEARAAIQMVARAEGLILDPVYTGKAFAGLLDLIEQGRFQQDEHIIFLHTGGLPGLWAYEPELIQG